VNTYSSGTPVAVAVGLDRDLVHGERLAGGVHAAVRVVERRAGELGERLEEGAAGERAAAHPRLVGGAHERVDLIGALEHGERRRPLLDDRAVARLAGAQALREPRRLGAGLLALRQQPLALALRRPRRRDVGEQDGHAVVRGAADAERVHVEPAAHRLRAVLEAHRLAGERHVPVGLHPVRLERRHELARRAPDGRGEPGLLLERRVGLEPAVVHRPAGRVEDHLHDAEPLVDRREERAVALLALAQRGLLRAALADVAEVARQPAAGVRIKAAPRSADR
jgi:hypothetical protein